MIRPERQQARRIVTTPSGQHEYGVPIGTPTPTGRPGLRERQARREQGQAWCNRCQAFLPEKRFNPSALGKRGPCAACEVDVRRATYERSKRRRAQ